jgi:hypothetical protein
MGQSKFGSLAKWENKKTQIQEVCSDSKELVCLPLIYHNLKSNSFQAIERTLGYQVKDRVNWTNLRLLSHVKIYMEPEDVIQKEESIRVNLAPLIQYPAVVSPPNKDKGDAKISLSSMKMCFSSNTENNMQTTFGSKGWMNLNQEASFGTPVDEKKMYGLTSNSQEEENILLDLAKQQSLIDYEQSRIINNYRAAAKQKEEQEAQWKQIDQKDSTLIVKEAIINLLRENPNRFSILYEELSFHLHFIGWTEDLLDANLRTLINKGEVFIVRDNVIHETKNKKYTILQTDSFMLDQI